MMSIIRGLIVFAIAVGGLGGMAHAADVRPMPKATVTIAVEQPKETARALIAAINAQRRAHGLAKLKVNTALTHAAQAHADDLTRRNYFGHTSPEGLGPRERVLQAGYQSCLAGETLSYSWKTVEQAMAGWMTSDGHRRIVLNTQVKDIGIGIGPNNLFVAVFAKGCR
ncbi:CAP domain-containing protein [Celeribacter baekdonensis]|jgi:uncharacterized protein YkwD|nr:CAP domain-containing protein [Celeribacter baekdonensis]